MLEIFLSGGRRQLIGYNHSDDEVEFEVLEAIADVHAAKFVRTMFVVELVTRPFERPDVHVVSALLDSPCALWLVTFRTFKEFSVERGCW